MASINAEYAHNTYTGDMQYKLLKPLPTFTCSRIVVHNNALIIRDYTGDPPPEVPVTIETFQGDRYGPIQYRSQHGHTVFFDYLPEFKVTKGAR